VAAIPGVMGVQPLAPRDGGVGVLVEAARDRDVAMKSGGLLRTEGMEVSPEDFRHVSPYAHEHILASGQFFFNLRRKERQDAYLKAQRL
jgi:hypothetical protein